MGRGSIQIANRMTCPSINLHIAAPTAISLRPGPRSTRQQSLDFIRQAGPDLGAVIADVGGGALTLVDGLLQAGYERITVLDVYACSIRTPAS